MPGHLGRLHFCRFFHQLSVIQGQDSIRHIEVGIVVGDGYDGFTAAFQLGKECVVEDPFEGRILVGSPFVEQVDGTIFQEGGEESESLALALGQLGSGDAKRS